MQNGTAPKCYDLHGSGQVVRTTKWPRRLLWAKVILLCFITAIYFTYWVFVDYIENSTATLVSIKKQTRLRYPSIVVCPKNPDALNMTLVHDDLARNVPGLGPTTTRRLIGFAIAGAGVGNMWSAVAQVQKGDMAMYGRLLRRWSANRTLTEFYEDLFERYGYTCEQLFDKCFYSSETMECCTMFRPTYVMLRGRCFRVIEFHQIDEDQHGKLKFEFKQLPSPLVDNNKGQRQVVVYLTDNYTDVGNYPRFYINEYVWHSLRFKMREILLLEGNPQCKRRTENKGRAACYVDRWLYSKVLAPLNCTLFYMAYKRLPYDVCEPEVVVRNYATINNLGFINGTRCLPQCAREEFFVQLDTSENNNVFKGPDLPVFRLEASYYTLEYERFEEVLTTTLPGFISQLGGQGGLFLGMSVMSFLQMFLSVGRYVYKWTRRALHEYDSRVSQ